MAKRVSGTSRPHRIATWSGPADLDPPRRDRPVPFSLPKLDTVADAKAASAAILQAVADGELTPSEAADLSKLLEGFTRVIEIAELERRLEVLEQARSR